MEPTDNDFSIFSILGSSHGSCLTPFNDTLSNALINSRDKVCVLTLRPTSLTSVKKYVLNTEWNFVDGDLGERTL